jgi:hypothetical protein
LFITFNGFAYEMLTTSALAPPLLIGQLRFDERNGMFSLPAELSALLSASKFLPLFKGTEIHLANREKIFAKITKIMRAQPRPGLRIAKYSYITEIEARGLIGVGYGVGNAMLLAYQKSIAEALERVIF